MDPSPGGGSETEIVDHSSSKFLEVFCYFFIMSSDRGQPAFATSVGFGLVFGLFFFFFQIVALGKTITWQSSYFCKIDKQTSLLGSIIIKSKQELSK